MPRRSTPVVQTIPDKSVPASIPRSFVQTMKDGIAIGAGSSIGHRLVSAVMGPPIIQMGPPINQMGPPINQTDKLTEYEQCIQNDKTGCEHLLQKKH